MEFIITRYILLEGVSFYIARKCCNCIFHPLKHIIETP